MVELIVEGVRVYGNRLEARKDDLERSFSRANLMQKARQKSSRF